MITSWRRYTVAAMKQSWKATLNIALIGAVAFWLPDTVVHAVSRTAFAGLQVWLLTPLMPVALFATFSAVVRRTHMRAGAVAVRMLGGIWLLGGLFMCIGATFGGGAALPVRVA